MKRIFTICLLLSIVACDQSNKVEGHWHVDWPQRTSRGYITIDVFKDSIAYIGESPIFNKELGYHDRAENRILFPGDCGSALFEYTVIGDFIYLENHLANYTGQRCENDCCTKLSDFTDYYKVKFDLPVIGENEEKHKVIELEIRPHFIEDIAFGEVKDEYDYFLSKEPMLELNNEFANLTDIAAWTDNNKSKHAESRQHLLIYRLLLDKDLSLPEIKPLIDELNKHGITRIVITCLKENYQEEAEMFEYVRIDKFDFEQELSLADVLK